MIWLEECDPKHLVLSVLERYPVHLSARSISSTIQRETGHQVSISRIVKILKDLPVDVTDTGRRKYKIIR